MLMEPNSPTSSDNYAADISSIRQAQVRIEPFAHKTPVLTSETLNSIAGRKLYFKCECFQKGGAFKFRGACNAIYSLDDDQADKGVVTHSSGNHAAALALAAKLRGIPAYIVIPKNAPKCKVENVKRYGGEIIWSEPSMQSREETANKVLQDTGAVLIHPYNDGRIISLCSGQGTISLELLEQAPDIDTLIVPISGGGLISGVALAAKAINPAIRILAAEPMGADDAFQSKINGRITKLSEVNTIADGLRAFLGDLTWPVVRDLVDDIIVVDDKEIIQAMRLCYEILKIAVEPSGAIGLAAVLSDSFQKNPALSESSHVGIVISGVISFARATGDLHTLSDVDLKLIALTYTLEAQFHGIQHLRDCPPPIHMVNVKRLPEKDLPGWGSNVPNQEEWDAIEHAIDNGATANSRILPLKDLSLNVIPLDQQSSKDGSTFNDGDSHSENQMDADGGFRKPRKYLPQKKEVKVEGKMVADGIDASQGQYEDAGDDWRPAVSRSTHRRFLRRKARREMSETSSKMDDIQDATESAVNENLDNCPADGTIAEVTNGEENVSSILSQMRLEEDSAKALEHDADVNVSLEGPGTTDAERDFEEDEGENFDCADGGLEDAEMASQMDESAEASFVDDDSSEQSWMLKSLSESSVACVTSDYAMQNVILQMGLRLVAPGGMQIRELHRWVLKCHACYKVTTDVGRIFCPNCGNGGTLRKVAVTVGENGIVLAARRPRTSLRGTKFSLPLPQGGRDAVTKNPVLREDQLPQKYLYPKTKKKNNQGDEIFIADDLFLHHNTKKAPLQPPVRKALAVFSGKRNPNDNHYSRAKH